jgi:Ni2+-binding GTPase involved in maturation of urease and hydrogenase
VKQIRLILVGGFLGSGKTTLLYRAAQNLTSRGLRVGLVTNDQAPGSVDTRLLAQRGLDVREVGGSCFCCNFPALLRNAGTLRKSVNADVILLEPVGSCTDLSATVLQPLKERFREEFVPSPLSVIVDPFRIRQVLAGTRRRSRRGSNYIFLKQLEEADLILLGKADLIDGNERKEMRRLLSAAFPKIPVRTLSPLSGAGVSGWLDKALGSSWSGNRIADVDYDVYAEGVAERGPYPENSRLLHPRLADAQPVRHEGDETGLRETPGFRGACQDPAYHERRILRREPDPSRRSYRTPRRTGGERHAGPHDHQRPGRNGAGGAQEDRCCIPPVGNRKPAQGDRAHLASFPTCPPPADLPVQAARLKHQGSGQVAPVHPPGFLSYAPTMSANFFLPAEDKPSPSISSRSISHVP